MSFSEFLESRRMAAKELVAQLRKQFSYASVLGVDVKARSVRADKNTTNIRSGGDTECGFVVKVVGNGVFFEYSLDDIAGDAAALACRIANAFQVNADLLRNSVGDISLADMPLVKSFSRQNDFEDYSQERILASCKSVRDALLSKSENILNAIVSVGTLEVSKLFVSENRELDQNYTWVNGYMVLIYRENGRIVQVREAAYDHTIGKVLKDLPTGIEKLLHKAHKLTTAKPIAPGVYDVITDPSITGLIAHEAFGHGVEMDMFVKNRAMGQAYLNKEVGSEYVEMHDGATPHNDVSSYFFDDEGFFAKDTKIIEKGILKTGIVDAISACKLGVEPTGNGKRESFKNKAYSRMTNTYFSPKLATLKDMVSSIKHGYLIDVMGSGLEDPKSWGIQCIALIGKEIVDGEFTGKVVSPIVMTGNVLELLKSISMVSKDFELIGNGACGKGYKEWVKTSIGGPYLKVKVRLG